MKITFRDMVWAGIVTLIVVALSKCHRDEKYESDKEIQRITNEANAKDSAHTVEQQVADNKLNIAIGQIQNATEKQQATDRQLSQSMTTIARLSAAVKSAKLLPEDTTFTMVSPEYINYCDSLAITGEKLNIDFGEYKQKTGGLLLSKDSAFNLQGNMLKQERTAYAQCRKDYSALQLLYAAKQQSAQKAHNQVYLGAELIGNQYTVIQNVGAVVSLKTKSNKLWQVSGGLLSGGGYYGRINGNILISFKK